MRKSILIFLFFIINTPNNLWAESNSSDIEIIIENDTTKLLEKNLPINQNIDSSDTLPPLEKEPVLLKFVEAKYPSELENSGIEGSVLLDLLINEKGTVDSVWIVKGLQPSLDTSIIEACKKFVFDPAIAEGESVAVVLRYEYKVSLKEIPSDTVKEFVNFKGKIIEKGTRNPISGIEIILSFEDSCKDSTLKMPILEYLKKIGEFEGQTVEGNAITTSTDNNGYFQFKSLPFCKAKVSVIGIGYEPFNSYIEIGKNEVTDVTYRIQKSDYSEYEIVVYGKSENVEVSKRTLTVTEVRKIPGFSGDAVKVVQALPGVARPSFGGGSIHVRGTPTWDSKFYLDGIPIPQLYHFGGVKSTYNSDALKSINFYPGGFSTHFGNAIAGVIELEGRKANSERLKGFLDIGLLDATVFAESKLNTKTSFLVTVRRSYLGDILDFIIRDLEIVRLPITVSPFYYDYIGRVDININKNNEIFFTLFGSTDKLELIAPILRRQPTEIDSLTDRVRQKVSFVMGIAGWDIKVSQKITNKLRASIIRSDGYGALLGFAKFDFDSWQYVARDEYSWKLSDKLKFNSGIELLWQKYHQNSVFPYADNTIFKYRLNTFFGLIAPFLEMEYKPHPSVTLIPGLRFDYYPELNYTGSIVPELWNYKSDIYKKGISGEPSFRILTKYNINEKQLLKAALGTYNQTPQPQGFVTDKEFGNPEHPTTNARHLVIGYEHRFSELVFADIQVYHNQQWKIPVFTTASELLSNPSAKRIIPEGKGRMYGLEVLLRHDNNGRFFGWIAYTLSRSERFNRRENRYTLYDRDQTHNLQLVASARLIDQLEAGCRLRYVTGNPETPIIGSVYDATNRFYRPEYGAENSSRNDPFFQLDIRVDKKFIFNNWILSAYLDLQNVLIFVYKSPEFTVYNYDYTEKTTVSFPFIPSFGIRAEF